jgi:hypothetical protein
MAHPVGIRVSENGDTRIPEDGGANRTTENYNGAGSTLAGIGVLYGAGVFMFIRRDKMVMAPINIFSLDITLTKLQDVTSRLDAIISIPVSNREITKSFTKREFTKIYTTRIIYIGT